MALDVRRFAFLTRLGPRNMFGRGDPQAFDLNFGVFKVGLLQQGSSWSLRRRFVGTMSVSSGSLGWQQRIN